MNDLPNLETELERRRTKDPDAESLWPRYKLMKDYLETNYYRWVQANCRFFTDHGQQHIQSVIQAASSLLRLRLLPRKTSDLSSIDIFLLLCAIIWHDTGMVFGRSGHADEIARVTADIRVLGFPDPTIYRLVLEIARAHGGRSGLSLPRTDEDISITGTTYTVHPRALAAVVRFADEVSENRSRISLALLPDVPEHNQIYWYYAASIVASRPEPERERVVVTVELQRDHLLRSFHCDPTFVHRADGNGKITLLEYVLCRLEKMNNELTYCGSHLSKFVAIREIEARLTILVDDQRLQNYDNFTFVFGASGLGHAEFPDTPLYNQFFGRYPDWRPEALREVLGS